MADDHKPCPTCGNVWIDSDRERCSTCERERDRINAERYRAIRENYPRVMVLYQDGKRVLAVYGEQLDEVADRLRGESNKRG